MAHAATSGGLQYALGIELPGGQMRTFLDAGSLFPTVQERVRLVSRLRERSRLQLRVLAKAPEQESICLGSARLTGIKLNPKGEAQLLVSMQSNTPEFVELQIMDELGKGVVEATFRLPQTLVGAVAPQMGARDPAEISQLLDRVTALEAELELRYTEKGPAANGRHADPSDAAGPTDDSSPGDQAT